jgi:hypothetical protein
MNYTGQWGSLTMGIPQREVRWGHRPERTGGKPSKAPQMWTVPTPKKLGWEPLQE